MPINFKQLSDRYEAALTLKQEPKWEEIPRSLLKFAASLDKNYSNGEAFIPVEKLQELSHLYCKNVGNGPNAVLKILNCHQGNANRFNQTADAAGVAILNACSYEERHARYWMMGSVANRALQSLVAKPVDDITYNRLIQSLHLLELGVWIVKFFDDWIGYIPVPEVHHENGIPTREDGPAMLLQLRDQVVREWFIQGVRVDEQIVLRPETQTIQQISNDNNEESRRIRIERYGWPKYLQDVGATSLEISYNERDQQWEQLFRLPSGEKRFVVSDPSTGRKYALRVEDTINTCREAQLWMSHGLDSLAIHRS